MSPRQLDTVVISDVHLGTNFSRTDELEAYLRSIAPKRLILNGDLVDIIQFRRGGWKAQHDRILQLVLGFAAAGVPVYYITGNHDAALRTFSNVRFENLHLVDELELEIAGKRTWIHHGDRFDDELATPGWLHHFGAWWYDLFVDIDCLRDRLRLRAGKGRAQRRIAVWSKQFFPQVARHIARFEEMCLHKAAERQVDQIICGHIHIPCQRHETVLGREVSYLNSGDWVDNLSALEFDGADWTVASYAELLARGAIVTAAAPEAPARPSLAMLAVMERISGRMPSAAPR
ncbi:MAG: UDP-2,3-diacylglucosamine diphosphatase [Planctomycetes bacterium]|nr:UDP-2,3-diacylglucosamine diphosphatase [Planctomycetota bacterium]